MISIIIPCFNSGGYLLEAIRSCEKSFFTNFEILVVDDGSTDNDTLAILDQIANKEFIEVIRKKNGGPASARNLGVENSNGEFLFFLDSDNRVRSDYFSKAISVMKNDSFVGCVYSKAEFFGDVSPNIPPFVGGVFSLDRLLAGNYIDMCTLVRKEAFIEVKGFDEHPDLVGFEDWDLWIKISKTEWKFHYLDEILFEYRVRIDSLMGSVDQDRRFRLFSYLSSKHGFLIHERYRNYFRLLEKIQAKPFSFFLRILYYKFVRKKSILD